MPLPEDPVTGFYTKEALLAVWKAAVDSSYSDPFITAGDGGGLEAYTQAFIQLSMASKAIERTAEACYITGYSGQTADPAHGGQKARVMLTFTRMNDVALPLVMSAGFIPVDEFANDYGEQGTLKVQTGRRFILLANLVFNPGEQGPFEVEAIAEKDGYGYNYPYPGTLDTIFQPGKGFENETGSVILNPGIPTAVMVAANASDVPIPEHVGQTLEFVSGANAGIIARVIGYQGPELNIPIPLGGAVLLESIWVIETTFTGNPQPGETVRQDSTGSKGTLLKVSDNGPTGYSRVSISQDTGQFQLGLGLTIDCDMSGAVFDCDNVADPIIAVIYQTIFVAESGTASWRIRTWDDDWAITVSNVERPSGGRTAMLDQHGRDRAIDRVNGETDDHFRRRISTLSDVITPNAVRRAINRVATPLGITVTLREPVGFELLPGFYLDKDALDYDPDLNENDRFRLLFDFTEFRAFMLVEVPKLGYGDFGWALDDHPLGCWDQTVDNAFLDGYPAGEPSVYKRIYAAVDNARAGGVGFDLYRLPE